MLHTIGTRPIATSLIWLSFLVVLVGLSVPDYLYFINNADISYQANLGYQVFFGKLPFVDTYLSYGPLAAYSSTLLFLVNKSFLPQALLSIAMYSLCLFIVYRLVVTLSSRPRFQAMILGAVASLAGYICLAKFYKWYYWFFPICVAYLLSRFTQTNKKYLLAAAGLLAGIGFLFRIDMGVACAAVTGSTVLVLFWVERDPRDFRINGIYSAAYFSAPILLWLIVLAFTGGVGAVPLYFSSYIASAQAAVTELSLPYPKFRMATPLSATSGHFLALKIVFLSYAAVLLWAGKELLLKSKNWRSAFPFWIVALTGIGLLPQALHRISIGHLMQVIPPFLVLFPLILERVITATFRGFRQGRFFRAGAIFSIACAMLFLILFSAYGMRNQLSVEYQHPSLKSLQTYRRLSSEMTDEFLGPYVCVNLRFAVQEMTEPDESILIVSRDVSHLYYWSDRRMSGLFNVYGGLWSSPPWRERNLRAVQADPPKLVIVDPTFFQPENKFKHYQPELYAWLSKNYPKIKPMHGGFVILTRD